MPYNINIEKVIENLLTPDSLVIKQCTKQLMDYFVSEKCVSGLFEVIKSSQNSQVRIYASNLLRKRMKTWSRIPENEKLAIKKYLIDVLPSEQNESVQKQLIWLMATIYRYSVKQSNSNWPELFEFVTSLIESRQQSSQGEEEIDEEKHLLGMLILDVLMQESCEQMKPHFMRTFEIFTKILRDDCSRSVYMTMCCLNHMLPYISESELASISSLFQYAINVSVRLLNDDESDETVAAVLELFQSFIEYDMPCISKHICSLTFVVISIISDRSFDDANRIGFMNFLNVLIETQREYLLKYELVQPIVECLFGLMLDSNGQLQIKSKLEMELLDGEKLSDDSDETNQSSGGDDENVFSSACQILDYCALYFPSRKLIPLVVDFAFKNMPSENYLHRRAALAALAITCEGCADYYKTHHVDALANACLKGMHDFESAVVHISYFALSQFSECLQPKFSLCYSESFMKIFIERIETNLGIRTISRLTLRFYGALQSFCECLGDDLDKHLATLMSKLMTLELLCSSSLKIKRLILATFSSIVSSVKVKFDPYFDYAFQLMKPHIQLEFQSLERHSKFIQIECIHLMAVLAKCISKDKFNSILIENSLLLVQNALADEIDPELKSATYHLLAALSVKLKEKLPLSKFMSHIVETLRYENVPLIDENHDANDLLSPFDEIDLDGDDDENEENKEEGDNNVGNEAAKNLVDNECVVEKLAAIYCIQEISKYKNAEFAEFYDECYAQLNRLLEFPNFNVRKESFLALAHLVSYNYEFYIGFSSIHQHVRVKFKENFGEFFRKSIKSVDLELNRDLVMNVFNSITVLLKRISPFVRRNLDEFTTELRTCGDIVLKAYTNKIYCQNVNKFEESTSPDNEAEYDFILKEYAGCMLPSIALCVKPSLFDDYFSQLVNTFIDLIHSPSSTRTQKAFSIGLIGEIFNNLESVDISMAQSCFHLFYQYLHFHDDADDDLRSNIVFSIGVLCLHSNNSLSSFYSQFLADLFKLIESEKSKKVLDNICGALSRLFLAYSSAANSRTIEIDDQLIVKKIFDLTPLNVDFSEYHILFKFILRNVSNRHFVAYYPKIINISSKALNIEDEELEAGTKELIANFLEYVGDKYHDDFCVILSQLDKNSSDLIKETLKIF